MLLDINAERRSVLCNFAQHSPTKATGVHSLLLGALWRVASPIFSRPIPLTLLTCGAFWLGISSPAWAQVPCDKRSNVLAHLKSKYQENPIAIGLSNTGGVVELITADDGKTWTLIISTPNGMACLIAAGESWESITVRLGKPS